MPPTNYNFLNGLRFGLFAFMILFQFSSCTQDETEVISTDEMQLIRTFVDLDMAGKTTFDNLPLEADWEKARIGAETIEVPLINPVRSFESNLDNFQTRLVIPKADVAQYRLISLESNFDHSEYLFSNLVADERADSWVRWMQMDSDLRSLEVKSYRTVSDPNANMPLDCTTVSYFERTCYYNGPSLVYCSDWELVSSYQVCTGEGGGGGGSNYKEDVIIKDLSFEGTKADCIYEKLLDSSEGFKKMIQKFDGSFSVSDLTLKQNNNLSTGNYGRVLAPQNGNITVEFSNINLGMVSDLGSAVSFAHEIIHAEIYRKMLSAAKIGNLDPNNMSTQQQIDYVNNLRDDFPGLYDYYIVRYKPTWNHNMMAQHYVNSISDIVREFDNNRLDSQIYDDISWAGLRILEDGTSSVAWANLTSDIKTRILNNITTYFHNGESTCD